MLEGMLLATRRSDAADRRYKKNILGKHVDFGNVAGDPGGVRNWRILGERRRGENPPLRQV